MNYLDSSALLKLIFQEKESDALQRWLEERPRDRWVSSEIVRLEVVRAAHRGTAEAVAEARRLVSRLDIVPLSASLLDAAADVGSPLLRSLDAIHLASAVSLGAALHSFIAYDTRLLHGAADLGLAVVSPS